MSDETTPQDDAAMSPASAGSVAGEPLAWVVMVGGERMYVSWCKEMCEDEAYYHRHPCGDPVSVDPLYRQPQNKVVRLPGLDPNGAPGWNAAIGAVREALADAGVDWDTE
jgi:hypothetical protein